MTPSAVSNRPLPTDHSVRVRLQTELDRTFFVEAGAGTGKTTSLVSRIVALVASGLRMEHLAAITFTDAAAAELRDRVRQQLEIAGADPRREPAERRLCERAALEIDLASIQTIHAFAGSLLRLFPLEAGLPPGFQVWNELEHDLAFHERFRRWLYDEVAGDEAREHAIRLALLLGLNANHLVNMAWRLQDHHDVLRPDSRWTGAMPPKAVEAAHRIGLELAQLAELLPFSLVPGEPLVTDVQSAQPVGRRLRDAATEEAALVGLKRFRDMNLTGWRGSHKDWAAKDGQNPAPHIKSVLKEATAQAHELLQAHRQTVLGEVLGHVRDFTLMFAEERRRQGVAAFHDLLVWARDLLRDNPEVRRRAHAQFERVLVDEFQDTDPLQVEIAWFLAADPSQAEERDWRALRPVPGRLFVVGDPKQSIYRFRRADIGMYEEVQARLGEGGEVLALTQNFRSVAPLLHWVNHHLGQQMKGETRVQPEYRALQLRPAGSTPLADGQRNGAYKLGGLVLGKAGGLAGMRRRARWRGWRAKWWRSGGW